MVILNTIDERSNFNEIHLFMKYAINDNFDRLYFFTIILALKVKVLIR